MADQSVSTPGSITAEKQEMAQTITIKPKTHGLESMWSDIKRNYFYKESVDYEKEYRQVIYELFTVKCC